MPVVLGPDGPSLGGFVCPATIVRSERWKMGQLAAGDRVRFRRLDAEAAVLAKSPETPETEGVVYRRAGDEYLLVEYGPLILDLALRLRVHALMQALERKDVPGIIDLTPGIRSLQVHYDPARLSTTKLLDLLKGLERDLPRVDEMEVPTRVVHLPLSWEDPATLLAIEKYTRSVRSDAPWCPSNIEFIRRINGLASVEDVKQIVFKASYLVLGLGDVYLGAPVATPMDPRHRLVTTKYNPARTWTPENAVGIGGAYLCIYGMEGPGGYQFVGRTLQVWNTYRQTEAFRDQKPYLLRFFDQIRFYPVGADELLRMRASFPYGGVAVKIEEETLRYRDYKSFLETNASSIGAFKHTQQAAFEAERERWRLAGQDIASPALPDIGEGAGETALPPGCSAVTSPVAGSLWKVLAAPGQPVKEGDTLFIVEAMKMEIAVAAPESGVVREVLVAPGTPVSPGQTVAILEGIDPSGEKP
jgi:urea carboxylase